MSVFRVLAIPIVLAFTVAGESSTWLPTRQVPQDFIARINQFVEMQRLVTAPLGLPHMCADAEELLRQQSELTRAIREGRPNAREGDMFTPDAARYFRTLIAAVASEQGLDLMAEVEDAVIWDTEAVVLEVNAPLPWDAGPMMWPSVLSRLPELPPELEYRFVGRDLVLVDMVGNTAVDVLRAAVPTYEESVSG